MDERLRVHYETLTRFIRLTRMADAKAAPVLGLHVVLVGTLATKSDVIYNAISDDPATSNVVIALLIAIPLYVVGTLAALVCGALVYIPRSKKTGESLIYFEDIAGMTLGSFRARARVMTPHVVEAQLTDQVYAVAYIVKAKMRWVRRAYVVSAVTVLLWIGLLTGQSLLS